LVWVKHPIGAFLGSNYLIHKPWSQTFTLQSQVSDLANQGFKPKTRFAKLTRVSSKPELMYGLLVIFFNEKKFASSCSTLLLTYLPMEVCKYFVSIENCFYCEFLGVCEPKFEMSIAHQANLIKIPKKRRL